MPRDPIQIQTVFPVCSRHLGSIAPEQLTGLNLAEFLDNNPDYCARKPFLVDLARLEEALYRLTISPPPIPEKITEYTVNPALELIPVQSLGLPEFLLDPTVEPKSGASLVLVWKKPEEHKARVTTPPGHDLLALKLVTEEIDSRLAAREGRVSLGVIDDILSMAAQRGLILLPESRIVRPPEFPRGEINDPDFFSSPTFTLQWHITQTCDLHCRHCYDRSDRTPMTLKQGIRVLDELYDFCRQHHVFTQISFTGGNPFLYPHFKTLYQEAVDRSFLTAILGNPTPRGQIEEIIAIRKPEFYQVSLEGLREHNDYIRGPGHFERILDCLDLLRELDIYSMVMLTLTRANMEQVLPLAEYLRERVDLFTFNRLAMVGEGADLASVLPEAYPDFLNSFLDAAADNPCIGLKDNMINILKRLRKQQVFGGCAGYGCGAAFNFAALLPDGEVHACRKFPSYIGNLFEQSLLDIYDSDSARRYRSGSQACATCSIRPVCGGCQAVTYGFGLDVFQDLDPYCFKEPLQNQND